MIMVDHNKEESDALAEIDEIMRWCRANVISGYAYSGYITDQHFSKKVYYSSWHIRKSAQIAFILRWGGRT